MATSAVSGSPWQGGIKHAYITPTIPEFAEQRGVTWLHKMSLCCRNIQLWNHCPLKPPFALVLLYYLEKRLIGPVTSISTKPLHCVHTLWQRKMACCPAVKSFAAVWRYKKMCCPVANPKRPAAMQKQESCAALWRCKKTRRLMVPQKGMLSLDS